MRKITKGITIALIITTILVAFQVGNVITRFNLLQRVDPPLVSLKEEPWGIYISAIKIGGEPTRYINLTEPDQYVREAIANLGKGIYVHGNRSLSLNSSLPYLIEEYITDYVKVGDEYYKIFLIARDPVGEHFAGVEVGMIDFLPLIFVCIAWVVFAILKGKSLIAPEIKESHPQSHPQSPLYCR